MKKVTAYSLPKSPANMGAVRWKAAGTGLLICVGTAWGVTQYVASQFHYQDALGASWLGIGAYRIYQPFRFMQWMWTWYFQGAPAIRIIFENAMILFSMGLLASFLTVIVLLYHYSRSFDSNSDNLHGSAHWADGDEVANTGLLDNQSGVYVGGWEPVSSQILHYLRHDGPEHVLAFAPTRSGKGVGIVIPTLLSWPHSVLVYDIKGENWALTSGWRKSVAKNWVVKFEPSNPIGSAQFNPLNEIRLRTPHEIADIQNIATMIVDPDGKGLLDHWQKTGLALLVGVILHVLYMEKDKTLKGVSSFLSNPNCSIEETLHQMLNAIHDPEGQRGWKDREGRPTLVHPVIAESAREMLNKADQERSGVLSTAMSFLSLYRDPIVAQNTSSSDFTINDIVNGNRPLSLYLVVPASDKDRLKPLIRLLINQIVRKLVEKMEYEGGRAVSPHLYRLLLLIDEFPSLGKLDIFEESLAYIASYGLKALLIIQDISQLQKAYGRDESIVGNCHIRVIGDKYAVI